MTNRLAVSVHQAGKTDLAHSGGPAAAAKAETSAAAARKKRRGITPGVVVKLASAIDDTSFNVDISGQAGLSFLPPQFGRFGNEAAATLNGLPWYVKTYPKFGVDSRDATMAGPRSAQPTFIKHHQGHDGTRRNESGQTFEQHQGQIR